MTLNAVTILPRELFSFLKLRLLHIHICIYILHICVPCMCLLPRARRGYEIPWSCSQMVLRHHVRDPISSPCRSSCERSYPELPLQPATSTLPVVLNLQNPGTQPSTTEPHCQVLTYQYHFFEDTGIIKWESRMSPFRFGPFVQ